MDHFDDFRLFERVADCGGISEAARRHGFPKSTLARRIAEFETRIGVRLIERGARRFALTEFGERCYAHCRRIAEEAEAIADLAEQARSRPAGVLRVHCPPVLGARTIEKLAAEFAVNAPDVRLHLEQTTAVLDPRHAQADLIVHAAFGPLPDSSLVAQKIHASPYTLVARPDILAGRLPFKQPQDLANVDCLGLGARRTDWNWVLRSGSRSATFRFEPRFSANVPSALLRAALAGLGVAALPDILCAEDLASGRLVKVLENWKPRSADIYAIYADKKHVKKSVRMFVDCLRRAFV
jgi:DNA-binding transcriptional LysR family regulator